MNLRNDETFRNVKEDIEINNGLMKDAWIVYKGEKWHPVIITDRETKVSGFEVNFSGKWGANNEVGRKKFPLAEFLEGIANGTFPHYAGLRCKRINDKQRNGRDFGEIQFSPRLKDLIARISIAQAGRPSDVSVIPSLKDEEVGVSPVLNIKDETGIGETDQNGLDVGDNENVDSDKSGSQGYEQDPEMRSAVELYAESIATKHYVSHGFRVQKFGKPFDLLCERESESIHVEVKGSRTKLDTVILTINEVSDAENANWQSDLFVVDQIVVERVGDKLVASGGVAKVIQKWVPAKEMLAPSQFRYRLPDENQWKFLK